MLMALATAAGLSGCSACDKNDPSDDTKPPIVDPNDPNKPKEPEKHVHNYTYTDNNNGTHTGHCEGDDCDAPDLEPEEHEYGENNECKCGAVKPEDNKVVISITLEDNLTLKDYEVDGFNFARYFLIRDDSEWLSARDYVDSSAVKAEAGRYEVVCTYKDKTASYTVEVTASEKKFTLSKTEIKINSSDVDGYDFKALFALTADGKKIAITDAMVTTDVKAEAGKYTYTVSFFGKSETLKVTVIDENAIEIVNSYGVLELTKEDLADFDYTKLFSLYVGEVAVKVLPEYIDASSVSDPEEGQTYSVTMTFERNGREASSTAQIKVVEKTQLSITAQNIETYPNGENIDLKSLFSIKNGNQIIEVTDDMITGSVDYSKEGENIITLNYGGREETATVTIRLGVIINYAGSDIVLIEKGTDMAAYDFGSDFNVIINGIRFTNLHASYFDTDGLDFTTEGEYEVTLKVPYNTKPYGMSGVKFDYFEKTITYKVVEKKIQYSIDILNDNVVLPAGTTRYNVYNNLKIVINGITRMPYEDRNGQDITTCYVQTVSPAVNFTTTEEQVVEIDVYVYGPDSDPIRVAYSIRVDNGVEVTGRERVVFSGTTVYARDLFTITENGVNVPVTDDMLSGKIDLFNAGIYFVTATYKGVTAQSKAVVIDSAMTGTYKTLLTEIEPYNDDDDNDVDYDESWGEYSLTAYSSRAAVNNLRDLTVGSDGDIYIGTDKAEIISIIDDSTFTIRLYTNEYVFHYEDGIITLDPDNSLRLTYHERRRPMVYFNEDKWKAESYVQINSNVNGNNVLQTSSTGNLVVSANSYTIDLIKLKSVDDGNYYWYGMKTTFLTKSGSDTYYAEEVFGFAALLPDFEQKKGVVSSVNLGGASYPFTMTSNTKATINKSASTVSAFAGMAFSGTVNGKTATFTVALNDSVTYMLDGVKVFSLSPFEQNSLKNAGPDYSENTWLVYDRLSDNEHTPYAYRFRLDTENRTFTLDERDDLFGRYVCGKVCFFFDGYGTGEAMFDTDSKYMTTAFSYKRTGANIEITYINAQPQFEYGKTAKFLLADYKNILTVREITGIDLVGKRFVNSIITDGAIVEVGNLVLGKGVAKKELLDGLSIQTKDGLLTYDQMENGTIDGTTKYVDVSLIRFTTAGFYQLKINIPMDGGIKSSYYAVQILDNVYSGNPLVGRYGRGAVNENATMILDEFGRVSGELDGVSFSGSAYISDGKFTANAECASGKFTISGELLANGIIKATARGALMFTDCFTTGTVKASGTEGYTLRAITAGDATVCMLSNAAISLGNRVEVEGNLNALDSVLKLTDGSKVYFVKVTGWDGADRGLVVADAVRGVYELEDADTLTLDGFGNAAYGTQNGTYAAYGINITVVFANEVKIFKIDTKTSTYTVSNTPVDASLFAGKEFTASYTFLSEDEEEMYGATTVFSFKSDGKVTVKSTSEEYEEDVGKYSPDFATDSGTEGTFTVAGNKITVKVNEKTIVFTFTDAVGLDTVKCYSTDVSSSSQGYFKPETEFTRV